MLLECFLVQEKKRITIDDFLVDAKTSTLTSDKIKFTLKYTKPKIQIENAIHSVSMQQIANADDFVENLSLDSEKDLNFDQLEMVNQNLDKIDEIQIVEEHMMNNTWPHAKTGHHKKLKRKNVFDVRTEEFMKNAIGKATISLAQTAFNPNMIISDKSDGLFADDHDDDTEEQMENEKNLKNYLEQTRFRNKNKTITSWLVRVNFIELKHILGNNEHLYCIIEIDDQLFRTKTLPIDCLKFNELFSHRIENIKSETFYHSIITISVYYAKSFFMSDTLIGRFRIDAGTVYKQPAHEFYHKWGLICGVGDETTRGFVKCDVIVQAKGDKALMHKEENEKDDDIDNNMIVPFGLDKPRAQIEVFVTVFSADVLFLRKITGLQKFTGNLALFKRSYLTLNEDESYPGDDLKRLEEGRMWDAEKEELEKSARENETDSANVFVRITFAGVTVMIGHS